MLYQTKYGHAVPCTRLISHTHTARPQHGSDIQTTHITTYTTRATDQGKPIDTHSLPLTNHIHPSHPPSELPPPCIQKAVRAGYLSLSAWKLNKQVILKLYHESKSSWDVIIINQANILTSSGGDTIPSHED